MTADERPGSPAPPPAGADERACDRAARGAALGRDDKGAAAERLRLALAAAQLSDWSWDARTDLFEFGARARDEIYHFPPGRRVDWRGLLEGIHPDDRDPLNRLLANAMAAGGDYDVEYRYRQPAGTEIWVRVTGRTTYAEDGSITGMIGVLQDVTERKRTESKLQEQARDLEILNETGVAIASHLDLPRLLRTVTHAATRLSDAAHGAFFHELRDELGERSEMVPSSEGAREIFERLGLPRKAPLFEPTLRGGAVVRSADVTRDERFPSPVSDAEVGGGRFPTRSFLAVPVTASSGEVIGGLFVADPSPGVFTERAERLVTGIAAQAAVALDNARLYQAAQKARESEQAARAEAERLSALKDDFLATLSHELRTPLGAVLGWAQVLRRRQPRPQELARGLEAMERNARLQSRLIEDLLDVSRITTGKVRLEVQPLDPVSFVEAAIGTMRPAAEAKGIRVERALEAGAGPVHGDPSRMQQVVWNLLSNAIKFTPSGGEVRVALARAGAHVEIEISDTGIGLAPDVLPHLFERFRQGDATPSRRHGGLGLGLSIVKHLVELHGGTVSARSAGPGLGATFTLQLPLAISAPPPRRREHRPSAAAAAPIDYRVASLAGLRVLVVDDESDGRDVVCRMLAECAAEVSAASSAAEALAQVGARVPDVLVSDIGMPEMDGYEMVRRLRALPGAPGRVPAIALTAFARSEDRRRALAAGFQMHVSKPVEAAELVAAVATLSGRPVAGREDASAAPAE